MSALLNGINKKNYYFEYMKDCKEIASKLKIFEKVNILIILFFYSKMHKKLHLMIVLINSKKLYKLNLNIDIEIKLIIIEPIY